MSYGFKEMVLYISPGQPGVGVASSGVMDQVLTLLGLQTDGHVFYLSSETSHGMALKV